MAGFLYYFPGLAEAKTAADLPKDCDLGHLDGASLNTRRVENAGPDGNGGLIVAPFPESKQGRSAQCGFYKDRQEWIEVQTVADGTEKTTHWLGWEKDERPTPEDLLRAQKVPGSLVEVAGHQWELACVHAPLHSLPMRFMRKPSGWAETVVPEYAWLVETAARFRECWYRHKSGQAGPEVIPSNDEVCSFCCRMFSVNYRLGEWECGVLGLADSRHWTDVLAVAWGVAAVAEEEDAKKKDITPANT